jgi:hypothetical protein
MTPGPRQQARAHAESCGEERKSVEMGSAGTRRPFCGEGCGVCWSAQQCLRPRKMGMRNRIRSLAGVGLILRSTGSEPNPQPRSRSYLRTDRSVCPPIGIPFFIFSVIVITSGRASTTTTSHVARHFANASAWKICPTLQRHNLWHEMRIL